MNDESFDRIGQLHDKLEDLLKKQEIFSGELEMLREEIKRLKVPEVKTIPPVEERTAKIDKNVKTGEIIQETTDADILSTEKQTAEELIIQEGNKVRTTEHISGDLEKFIGENLINKVGIAITVIGVAIGVKYAIDHELISPLTRIILGYLFGSGLFIIAIRLKKQYENFSAVLLSGSMTIMYFITYAAYSFYSLVPQIPTFILMVIITVLTVTSAINYNRQVIAHIGLVGAYAVPFLLGGAENVTVLFSYTAIINIGILAISFKKYWKLLYYSSFIMTWLIYLIWFGSKYQTTEHFRLASIFLLIFFVTFYLMFLAYKLLQKEKFDISDIILLLANSFIFYGVGYSILSKYSTGGYLPGLFTFGNAVIHFLVSIFIYRQKPADRNLFYLVSGLSLIFLTIAIPVQLNGNWVTLIWSGEAALLFWIGRTRGVKFYEVLAYALMFFAFISFLQDLALRTATGSEYSEPLKPVLNIRFISSLLVITSFVFINYLNYNKAYPSPFAEKTDLFNLISFSTSGALLTALYFAFQVEISAFWDSIYEASLVEVQINGKEPTSKFWNSDLLNFKRIALINYSLLFLSVFSFLNIKKLRSRSWGYINLFLSIIAMAVFLFGGLYILSELRESYMDQTLSEFYHRGGFNVGIRYITFVFAGLLLFSAGMYTGREFLKPVPFNLKIAFDLLLYTSLIWILSSEMISWMDIMHSSQTYKLGLSILWGVFALFLIGLGIWKKKKHLRIGAIVLFSVTLLKLFLFDLSHIDTIAKTIIFITLGILLLIISFLYIKYKASISESTRN